MAKWTKKTMTWGGYAAFCGIIWLISIVITGGIVLWPTIKDKFEDLMDKFKK